MIALRQLSFTSVLSKLKHSYPQLIVCAYSSQHSTTVEWTVRRIRLVYTVLATTWTMLCSQHVLAALRPVIDSNHAFILAEETTEWTLDTFG